jgi:hypothetical protein
MSAMHVMYAMYVIAVRYSAQYGAVSFSERCSVQFGRLLAVSAGHKRQRARRDSALNV